MSSKVRAGSLGFTLVELLIVTLLGTLVIMATLNVLISNQRTLTAVASKIQGQQTLRSGMSIITGELREISPATGDLIAMGVDTVEVRVARGAGLVCAVDLSGGGQRLTVKTLAEPFEQNDSIFVLAANNPILLADDVWKLATIRSVGATTTCSGSDTAQVLTIGGTTVGPPPDSISVGAPVRSFTHYLYGLFLVDGEVVFARRAAGSVVPAVIVGPLKRVVGQPTFRYWTSSGTVALIASEVAGIEVMLRTDAQIPGRVIEDSLLAFVHPRN